ncbi:TlpA disulfide reductase family protein [Salinimicrobium sp. TIG7-5_MAKvit]|uniref:TlpA family protein disulfide reductase n=1 Tax=Salinimicrobium sp. TIG7-5_MAKvit TaxID=3121289 RepID=UPI003C6DD7D6
MIFKTFTEKRNPFYYFLCFFIATLTLISCGQDQKASKSEDPEPMVVTGKIENFGDTVVDFSYYTYEFLNDLEKEEVAFDGNGNFRMELHVKNSLKGWFSFGKVPMTEEFTFTTVEGKDTINKASTMDFRMVFLYLEPGDSLHVTADVEKMNETLAFSGNAAANNDFVQLEETTYNSYKHKFLKNWYNLVHRQPNEYKQITDSLRDEKLAFLDTFAEEGKVSPILLEMFRNDYISTAVGSKIYYPAGHASYNELDSTELPSDYFDFLGEVSLKDDIGSNGIGYFYNLRSYLRKKYELAKLADPALPEFYEWTRTELPEEVRYEFMAYSLSGDFSRRLYDEFGENTPYPEMAKVVKEKYRHLEGMLEGNPAPEIVFQDIENKDITLTSFQGKYTYIDLWATWCGPCIKEIPSLQKLEKEYSDRNIQFVSVSIDEEKDLEKWKRFVREKNLTGHQLIADKFADSILATTFNIKNIPRFLLLDPEGKIVDASAPFPSDPELVALFKELNI